MDNRLAYWDRIRVWGVYVVVMLHSAMSYMVPLVPWWYVNDRRGAPIFTLIVVALDVFPMPALFFASGYFAPPSFNRRGVGGFMREKLVRIGIPWLFGAFVVGAVCAAATMRALGYPIGPAFEFYTKVYIGPAYQQGPYWFLGVLLLFFCIYTCFGERFAVRSPQPVRINLPLVAAIWVMGSVAFYLGTGYKTFDEWMNVGNIIYFQHCRFVGHLLIFFLGAVAWRDRWFDGEPENAAALSWLLTGVVCVVAAVYLRVIWGGTPKGLNLAVYAVAQQGGGLFVAIGGTLFLRKYGNQPSKRISAAANASYGLYWLHIIILMPIVYIMVPLGWSPWLKFAASSIGTVVAGEVLTLVLLRKAPLLRKMF